VNIKLLAKKVWLRQLLLLVSAALICSWFDKIYAKSILIGGLIFLLPTMYFALLAFRTTSESDKKTGIYNMYRGEMGKFILTSAGFAVTFVALKPIDGLILFSTYLVMTIVNIVLLSNKELS